MRKVAAVVGIVAGIFLLIIPFSLSLFSRTSHAEQLTNRFRPVFTAQGVATLRQDFNTFSAAGAQLTNATLPGLAKALDVTPSQLNTLLAQKFPDVAAGVTQLPTINANFNQLVTLVEQDQTKFHSTDMIPVSWLPKTAVPWIYIVIGALLVLAGGACLWRPTGRGALAALAIVGAIAVGLPIGASFFSKVSAAHNVVADLRVPLSPAGAATAQAQLLVVERMGSQLTGQLLPALATELHMTPAQLDSFLAANFPAVTAAVTHFGQLTTEFNSVVGKLTASTGDYRSVSRIPFPSLPWLLLAPGAVCLLLAALGLLRPERIAVPKRTPAARAAESLS